MHVVVMGCVCQSLIKKLLTYLLTYSCVLSFASIKTVDSVIKREANFESFGMGRDSHLGLTKRRRARRHVKIQADWPIVQPVGMIQTTAPSLPCLDIT